MLLPLFQALKAQYAADQCLMRFQWLDPRNYNLRAGLKHGLNLVLTHQPHLALVDFTNLPSISTADELWMSVHWFPRVLRQQLRRVALVSRFEHLHNQLAVEAMFWVARHLMNFQVQVFEDETSALDWLLSGDTALVQLLCTEWHASSVLALNPLDTSD